MTILQDVGKPKNTMNKTAMIGLFCAISVMAGTITQTYNLPQTRTDWSQSIGVNQFDPSTGYLKSITITTDVAMTNLLEVENLNTYQSNPRLRVSSSVDVVMSSPAGTVSQCLVTNYTDKRWTIAAFDGTLDYLGPSSAVSGSSATKSSTAVLTEATLGFSDFIGDGTVTVNANADGWASASASGNIAFRISTYGAADISIVYDWAVGTATPGFWKTHPDEWPVEEIVIGGSTFTKDDAIYWLNQPAAQDKTITMFRGLVSAKLNVIEGNESSCVDSAIATADEWMTDHPVGSEVAASSADWQAVAPVQVVLDDYNNGQLCAPHRH